MIQWSDGNHSQKGVHWERRTDLEKFGSEQRWEIQGNWWPYESEGELFFLNDEDMSIFTYWLGERGNINKQEEKKAQLKINNTLEGRMV